ncbi:hypothetical protein ABK01_02910 [Treponema sp. OMZ 305]|uniref:hypothetical protein n=1 Tax=Treponema sp. OMZ 805 TaxID=2726068 RepID=UPI00220256BA|nr:hypothetical protein ABK01_02910 [Treponema sp. OMZ 305]
MLNVQSVRLRFISPKLLASASSISKGLRKVCFPICRCCEKINPQRIISDTDVGGTTQ